MTDNKEFDLTIGSQEDPIRFSGMAFPCREVSFPNEDCASLIATESLERALLTDADVYVNPEAQRVDDQIFFFVPDNVIHQSSDFIKQLC